MTASNPTNGKSLAQRRKQLEAELRRIAEQEKLEASKAVTDRSVSILNDVLPSFPIGKISKAQAKKLGQFLSEKGIEELLKKL
jgi:hypothetical protein